MFQSYIEVVVIRQEAIYSTVQKPKSIMKQPQPPTDRDTDDEEIEQHKKDVANKQLAHRMSQHDLDSGSDDLSSKRMSLR